MKLVLGKGDRGGVFDCCQLRWSVVTILFRGNKS